jgi:hypothetical protein
MIEVLSKFRVCEPATRQREQANFLANFSSGRPVDFKDSTSFVFNPNINDFNLNGTTFNNVFPVDRYGLQQNFEFPSIGLRRKEMSWSTSTFPVQINANTNSGFDLFGTYIGIRKISTTDTVDVFFSSISAIVTWVESYNSSNGDITFRYDSLPSVYTETDSAGSVRFSIEQETNWAASTYNSSLSSNTIIGSPIGVNFVTKEKYKELNFTVSTFDKVSKTITGNIGAGISNDEIYNIQMIAPRNQTVRIIPLGGFSITNNALGVPTATSLNGLQSGSSMGLTSYIYYGIPYQTGNTYANTSRDYFVRTPVFTVDLTTAALSCIAIAIEKKTVSRLNPNGFRMGMK